MVNKLELLWMPNLGEIGEGLGFIDSESCSQLQCRDGDKNVEHTVVNKLELLWMPNLGEIGEGLGFIDSESCSQLQCMVQGW